MLGLAVTEECASVEVHVGVITVLLSVNAVTALEYMIIRLYAAFLSGSHAQESPSQNTPPTERPQDRLVIYTLLGQLFDMSLAVATYRQDCDLLVGYRDVQHESSEATSFCVAHRVHCLASSTSR